MYECRNFSFKKDANNNLIAWKSTGIYNYSPKSDLKYITDAKNLYPSSEDNGRMNISFNGNYFKQNKMLHPDNNSVVNIYIVYKLDPISFSINTDCTIQNV